jgi:methionine-rich copper-binding protein CopC
MQGHFAMSRRRSHRINATRGPGDHATRAAVAPLVEVLERRMLLAVNPIVTENQLPGTPQSTWDVSGAGDSTILGFTTDISANLGQTVNFKINDTANAPYRLDIYRMGYYQGNGARLVATVPSSQTIRKVQPNPLTDNATGLVDCGNWSVTASWAVPASAVSGIYFARIVREDTGGASRIVFVVRDDTSHADLLFQTSDTTWQAYNQYGGNSLYLGNTVRFPGQSDPNRAAKVSYNRPLTLEGTTGGYGTYNSPFHGEYPMVRWLERNGYDVAYFTDVDSDRNGALIKNHKSFLSVGHDEYWSGGQRANVEAARDAGVNMAFFSGNEVFWKTRWETSIDSSGTPYRTLVSYKESKAGAKIDPAAVWTGTWRDNRFSPPYDGGRPENSLSGVMYMNDRTSVEIGIPMQVPAADGKLRFWRNTSVANLAAGQTATIGDRVVGYETDEDLDNGFRPAGLIGMSSTAFTTSSHVIVPWGTDVGPGSSIHKITLYRAPSGALVFGSGTVQWSWGLDGVHLDGNSTTSVQMQQATVNLFADMGVQPGTLMSGLVAAAASTDFTKPSTTISSPAPGSTFIEGSVVTISGTAADTGGGIVGAVEVSTDGGLTWHPVNGRATWTYSWSPDASGTVTIKTRAADDSGNIEIPGTGIVVNVAQPTPVLAMGFEEGAGTAAADSSGAGNNGTLANATWTTAGRYGKALSFNGSNSWVTVADAASLDLTQRMTLEAWVKPASLIGWTTVVIKERGTNGLAYSLYNSDDTNRPPAAYINAGGLDQSVIGPSNLPLNSWSFLAATFDGANLRLYLNGNLVSTRVVTGGTGITTTTNPLRIGGNSMWGEYFNGLIDEVRVYNVALGQADINKDMNTPASGPPDTTAPTVSVTNPANNATVSGTVNVTANASDNVGVAGVQFLLNGANLGAEDTASPYSVSWDTTTVANGAYVITARARDGAGNVTTSTQVNVTVSNVDSTPPTVTARTPAPGSTNVPLNTTATATFSEPVQSATISFVLKDPANNTVPGTVSYNSGTRTATLTPSSPLSPGTLYTATVSGAADLAGNVMASPSVWSFTTGTPDTTPPSVTAQTPAAGAVNVPINTTVTAQFSESIQSATLSFVLRDSANNVVPATVAYNDATRTATLTPNAVLANSTTYTATVSGAQDQAGNAMTAPVSWSFTTASIGSGPFSIWSTSTVPQVATDPDPSATEIGVRFRSDVAGTITAIRFYKGSTNTGTHTGHLWTATGTLLATATFVNETATGWQQVSFPTPVAIAANTTYVASYHAPAGHYAEDDNYFASTGVDNGPLHALRAGVDGFNGVYNYGPAGTFPTSNWLSANYWVDIVLTTGDISPPTVTAKTPAAGATNVPLNTTVTATFSESIQPGFTFTLKDAANNSVAASVVYNDATRTATLTPNSPLNPGITYTATVSGAKDAANNIMTSPVTWSFTTVVPDTTPPNITSQAPAPGATGVSTGTTVTATFSESVQPGTISFVLKDAANNSIPGTVSYNDPSRTATFTPSAALNPSTTYTATVSGAQDLAGNPMTAPVSWSFTTFVPDTNPPTVTTKSPAAGATNVPLSTTVSATFSEAVQSGTITFTLADPSNNPVAANLAYNVATQTATLTPLAALANGTTYTATVSGAKDLSGNTMTAPVTWSFTTVPDTTPPTVTAQAPIPNATNVPVNTTASATFSEAVQPATISFVVTDPSNNAVAGAVSYNAGARTATFTPSAALTGGIKYTATVSGAQDLAGNILAAPVTWNFTTTLPFAAGPFTVFSTTAVPADPADADSAAVELGMKFRADVDGVVTGARFYKGSTNTGVHVGSLWSSAGALLATVTFANESASGWQQASFSTPVAITANTTYVISYHTNVGHYSVDNGFFTAAGVNNGPLHGLTSGVDGLNGTYAYGASSIFPVNSFQDSNYWVDVVFARNAFAQTTAAQFNTGTASGVAVTTTADGELQLAPGFRDDFNGTSVDASSWTTTSWTGAGGGPTSVTVSGGILNVLGAQLLSTQTTTQSPVEGRVTIAAAANRYFGLATDLTAAAGNYWAAFTTGTTTNSLYARVNNNGTITDVRIANLPSGYHTYRVNPIATGFQFYLDGTLRTTINQTFPVGTNLKMVVSSFTGSPSPVMRVDWARFVNNAPSGTFTSSVLDAGRAATWGNVNWNAALPAGTSMIVEVRSGNTATPDGSWSAWSSVNNGGAIGLPAGRYLQYRITFVTSDTTQTPTLFDIQFSWT